MLRFNDPSALRREATATFSPDGKYFAVVTSRGLLRSNEIESTLSLFREDQSEAFVLGAASVEAPRPWTTVAIAAVMTSQQSDAYGAIITNLRWSKDSSALYFIGEGPHAERRLYRVNVAGGEPVPLSPNGYNVARFDFTKDIVVYSAWPSNPSAKAIEARVEGLNEDARDVTGESINSILFPQSQPAPTDRELWTIRNHPGRHVAAPVPVPSQRDISWLPEAFSVSPSGHLLIQLQPVMKVPAGWSHYEPGNGFEYKRIRSEDPGITAPDNIWRLKQYSLVNLNNGTSVPLVEAPHGYTLAYTHESRGVWSHDERRVLVTNTFLSKDETGEGDQTKRIRPCAIADVELPSRRSHCVVFLSDLASSGAGSVLAESLAYGRSDDEVTFRVKLASGGEEERRYTFRDLHWEPSNKRDWDGEAVPSQYDSPKQNARLRVTVRQGLNKPPTLWVTDIHSGQSKQLWDPNPQFATLQFGEASVYRWRDNSGHGWKGGLVRPVGYVQGERYPLVIQIYDFDDSQFLTDGMMPTAFSARALASAGIVALQVQRKMPHSFDTSEADAQLAGIQSAIHQLSEEGIVNPRKVGLVGFSSTCWYVENALIKDPDRFVAATIADGMYGLSLTILSPTWAQAWNS
jgi:dipeptidyl aminopeptidase/acylaminoacyl peptidase